jgi:hypothetical protein
VALVVHAIVVDAHGLDAATDHKTMQPRFGPFDFAFEMTAAFLDTRMLSSTACSNGTRFTVNSPVESTLFAVSELMPQVKEIWTGS